MEIRTAFVIEDDNDLATIFSEAMRAAGFEPEIIQTGEGALIRLGAAEPNVVVLDMHLPDIAGLNILTRIRDDPRLTSTRVIVATADARLAEMLEAQADLVLVKPVSFTQLRDLARRMR